MYVKNTYHDDTVMVSVIMGTRYIKEDITLLKRAVSSILNQSFADFEFLICDDGSSDNAKKYLESLKDQRIRLIRRENCIELSMKLNLCLKESLGKYIARMDDDDWSHPDRLEKELNYLLDNDEIDFVGCNVSLVQNGNVIGKRNLPVKPSVEDFYITQPYVHPTLMFRSEALKKIKGYSEHKNCVLCEDYDLLLRMYKAGFSGLNLQEILLDYTIPTTPKGNRKMSHRFNEVITRYNRFRELGVLPGALPYVVKPILVGLLPDAILDKIKRKLVVRE